MLEKNDIVDHQRWLLDHGFVNDLHKDNLYMYGAICHMEVEAVELSVDIEKKTVSYELYMGSKLLKNISMFKELSGSKKIYDLWRFKRLLKKQGNLNFDSILTTFVRDYLGPKWSVVVNLKDIKKYEEGFKQDPGASSPADQPVND